MAKTVMMECDKCHEAFPLGGTFSVRAKNAAGDVYVSDICPGCLDESGIVVRKARRRRSRKAVEVEA